MFIEVLVAIANYKANLDKVDTWQRQHKEGKVYFGSLLGSNSSWWNPMEIESWGHWLIAFVLRKQGMVTLLFSSNFYLYFVFIFFFSFWDLSDFSIYRLVLCTLVNLICKIPSRYAQTSASMVILPIWKSRLSTILGIQQWSKGQENVHILTFIFS